MSHLILALFALAGLMACAIIAIEIRRAFLPHSLVRELARRVRDERYTVSVIFRDVPRPHHHD